MCFSCRSFCFRTSIILILICLLFISKMLFLANLWKLKCGSNKMIFITTAWIIYQCLCVMHFFSNIFFLFLSKILLFSAKVLWVPYIIIILILVHHIIIIISFIIWLLFIDLICIIYLLSLMNMIFLQLTFRLYMKSLHRFLWFSFIIKINLLCFSLSICCYTFPKNYFLYIKSIIKFKLVFLNIIYQIIA
jgi:hypothetical protein